MEKLLKHIHMYVPLHTKMYHMMSKHDYPRIRYLIDDYYVHTKTILKNMKKIIVVVTEVQKNHILLIIKRLHCDIDNILQFCVEAKLIQEYNKMYTCRLYLDSMLN